MSTIKIPTSFNIDLEFQAADLGQRFLAWLIDFVIKLVFMVVFVLIVGNMQDIINNEGLSIIFLLGILIPVLLYPLLFEMYMNGQTPGKKAMDIRVVSMIGNTPSRSQFFTRYIFRLIEQPVFFWALLPIISILRSPLKQRVGDIAAATIVINIKTKGSISETIFRDLSMTDYKPQFPEILRLSDRDMNKIKEMLDRALSGDKRLAERVANRVKEVLKINTTLPDTVFLETVLNDYNYYTTVEK